MEIKWSMSKATHGGSNRLLNSSHEYFNILKIHHGTYILRIWQIPHVDYLICVGREGLFSIRKAKWKLRELPLSGKTKKQKNILSPEEWPRLVVLSKLQGLLVVVSPTSYLTPLFSLGAGQMDHEKSDNWVSQAYWNGSCRWNCCVRYVLLSWEDEHI